MANPTLTIPAPEFEKSTPVWLHFKGAIIPTSIKVRAYDPDKAAWYYRISMSGQWHKASELPPRLAELETEGQAHV